MEVKKLEDKEIPVICNTINARLLDSVEASFQLEGISDKQNLLDSFTRARIAYWQRIGEVWVIGDNLGMLAGHYRKNESIISSIKPTFSIIKKVFGTLSKEDKAQLKRNLQNASGAENTAWRKQECKNSDYYYIDLIVIDHKLTGSGAFRQLIDPVIARMEQEDIPILLDTHDKDNVPLYQHFGFEIVHTYQSKYIPELIQYAMIKRPHSH